MNKHRGGRTPFKIHPLFWLVIGSGVWTGYFIELFTLFVVVLVHELGHLAAAQAVGWRIRSLELLPFGGVLHVDEWGTVPARDEVVVALAGPFQHLFMILFSLLFYRIGYWSEHWTVYFIQANCMIACFNLLPIYPLDGGKVLQAVMSYFFPYRLCISFTLIFSMVLSCFLLVCAFLLPETGIWLHLAGIALFLLFSNVMAWRQKNFQYIRFLLSRSEIHPPPSGHKKKLSVLADTPLKRAIKHLYKEKIHEWEVLDRQGRVLGCVTEKRMLDMCVNKGLHYLKVKELLPKSG
ncbi:site-2 protease family protein [Laceyella putida]|uniref:Site-2 protease family protein n=1 Tax=Laceyella putida TaxID=110101 RepID=A0ABW2RJB7_9BACL